MLGECYYFLLHCSLLTCWLHFFLIALFDYILSPTVCLSVPQAYNAFIGIKTLILLLLTSVNHLPPHLSNSTHPFLFNLEFSFPSLS